MNFPVFSTCICLLVSYGAAVENTVPVFILDYDQVMTHVQVDRNPFTKVTSNDFAAVVKDSAKYKVIIFLEDSFSVEDISTKNKFFGTPYKNLQSNLLDNPHKVKYLPSVIQPTYVLRKHFPPRKENVFYLAQRTKLQLKDSLKYVYMYFQDFGNETKVDVLRRHDNIIREVMGALRAMKAGPVIAYYTGKVNPVTVKKVEFVKDSKKDSRKKGIFVQTPRVLFQLYGVHATHQTRRFYYDQQPTVIEEIPSKHQLTAKFALSNMELKWQFAFYKYVWVITDLFLYEGFEQVGHIVMPGAGAPHNYSYYCDDPVHITNVRDGTHLTIDTMLVDAANQNAPAGKPYNPLVHCAPFYSSESLSCFVCGTVLFSILLGGILLMIDCSSYDRFDDANAKPLLHERMH